MSATGIYSASGGYNLSTGSLGLYTPSGGYNTVSVTSFGAKVDGLTKSDLSITSGQAVLTSSSYQFQTSDVGKSVTVAGAGTAGAVLNTTISSVSNGTAILAINAGTTVTSTGVGTWGTDDTAAFQQAVNSLSTNANLGGTIVLPIGTTIVTSVTWAPNVSVVGYGAGKSIVKFISTSDPTVGMFTNTSGSLMGDIQFRNFQMDMTAATANGGYQVLASCIRISVTKRLVIDGCYFVGSAATTLAADFSIELQITHNTIENYGRFANASSQGGAGIGIGINAANTQSYLISDNIIIQAQAAQGTYGIFFEEETAGITNDCNILVANNILIGTSTIAGIGDCGSRRMAIINNHITSSTNNTGDGIAVKGGTTSFLAGEQGIIANNTITAITGSGIVIDYTAGIPSGQLCGYLITGNRIQAPSFHGIKIVANASTATNMLDIKNNNIQSAGLNGIIFTGAGGFNNINIVGNTIINNGTGGTGITAVGVSLSGAITRFTMIGNDIFDTGGGTQKYAIGVNTSIAVTGANISNNNFANNNTGAITLIGGGTIAGVIQNNTGYNPIGAAAVTPTASPYTYTAGNSPEILYIAASTSITALTVGAVSILPIATSANGQIAVNLPANGVAVITYTGTLTATKYIQ